MDGGFGAAVDVLDRWGVMTQETFLVARFGRGEAGRQASRKVLAGTGPEFIKLRVRLLGRLPVPAPRYVLTVEVADGQQATHLVAWKLSRQSGSLPYLIETVQTLQAWGVDLQIPFRGSSWGGV